MKKLSTLLLCLIVLNATAQESSGSSESSGQKNNYLSFSTEMIFSFAAIDNHGNDEGNKMRWAPVINPNWLYNHDFSQNMGMFTGLFIRNVGFIYDDPNDSLNNTKLKFRTYNIGVPLGLKFGNIDKVLFFAGYEVEFPFVYKEKLFINEDKEDKDVIWFSDRVEQFQHGVMGGFQFRHGATLKFKYYLSNFHNRDYVAKENGFSYKPYDFKANVFYISLAWNMFTDYHDYIRRGR